MTLHKFTCTECPTNPFYTSFYPKYDSVPCPCCADDGKVTYQGPVNMEEVAVNVRQSEVA